MYFPLLPVIKHLVEEKFMSPETTSFGWAGGEPSILKELNEGYALLLKSVKRIIFSTNAVVFSDVIYRNLGKENVAETFIKSSIDAGTADKYKEIRGRDFFDRAFDNLQKYAERSPQTVYAKYIVLTENCNLREIRSFIKQVYSRNIKRVIISSDYARWSIPARHWAALETLFAGLKSKGIEVVFTHHLMSVINAADAEKVPAILYSGYMDYDCPTCWPSESRKAQQGSSAKNMASSKRIALEMNS